MIDVVLCLSGKRFRGHNEKDSSVSKGLFLDILGVLKKYDNLLANIHNVMIKTITSNVENKFVSIIADETSDCGHYEQLSIVIRFFDEEKNEAVKQFIGLQRLVSVDAQSIFNCLTNTIAQVGLK